MQVAAAPPGEAVPGPAAETSSLRYMPGLDVLRGIAILMVLVHHATADHPALFSSSPAPWLRHLHSVLWMGYKGVHLFFILSGFLITGILLDSRERPDFYRNFYLRRILRIVPTYVLMLAVLFFTHSITARYLAVCLLYFCNMSSLFGVGPQYSLLWSLSVEEQFYLFWPMLVRKLTTRGLFTLSVFLILLTPPLRLVLAYAPAAFQDTHYKTWVLLDYFGAGTCLAIAVRSARMRAYLPRLVAPLLASGFLLFLAQRLLPDPTSLFAQNVAQAVSRVPWLIFFTGLVVLAYLRPQIAGSLPARPLVFLGNISYGLYLCHVFLFHLVARHWPQRWASPTQPLAQLAQIAVQVGVSIAVAFVSRYTFEQFFLRLKPRHQAT